MHKWYNAHKFLHLLSIYVVWKNLKSRMKKFIYFFEKKNVEINQNTWRQKLQNNCIVAAAFPWKIFPPTIRIVVSFEGIILLN